VRERLGVGAELLPGAAEAQVHLRRLIGQDARTTLIKLFFLGGSVEAAEARAALPGLELARLEEIGVLEEVRRGVRALLRLVPHRDVLVACDRYAESEATIPGEVPGVTPPSAFLANLTVRMHFVSALDVGTGSGLQALLAARHTDRVVAADVNSRALEFTRFGARLNGLDNVECVKGSLLEAVAGHSFGLITATPAPAFFRDEDALGNELCRDFVRGIPAHLSEGGFAHMLVDWALHPDEEWWAPLEEWVAGSGCDALLLHYKADDPASYAASLNSHLRARGPEAFGEALDRWTAAYRELGADRLASGAIVLRRRSRAPNWVRRETVPTFHIGPAGDQVVRAFVNHDLLASAPDHDQLLAEVLAVVEPQRIEQIWRHKDEGLELESATVRLDWGFGFAVGIDSYTIQLLARIDGRRRLRELFADIARDSQLEEDMVARAGLPAVRRLLELGFLARA
jgi:methylase of polypeptide subunit release factors